MKIAVSNPEFFFSLFYILAFAVTFLLFIIFSARLKIPVRSTLLILTTSTFCTIVGSRLSTIPFNEWGRIIFTGNFEGYHGRFAVGGLLFGLAGLWLCRKILGPDKNIINLYAWITPVGLGIQKAGCFVNGCCYGRPSSLPWSVQYPELTNAHYHHWVDGLIKEHAAFSLGVHPVQLYETILLFVIAYIVWRSLKRWKKPWSALIFSLALFFLFRFAIEFLRDPATSKYSAATLLGISIFQWVMLFTGIGCFVLLFLYEKSSRPVIYTLPLEEPGLRKLILYIFCLSLVIYVFRGLFTSFEWISLNIKFIPAVVLSGIYVFNNIRTVSFRLTTTSLLAFPLFIVAQTFITDTAKSVSVREFYSEVKSYKRIDINTSFGEFYNTVRYNPHEGECGTIYTHEDYRYEYRIAGAGYSSVKKDGKAIETTGINLYGGMLKENNLTEYWSKSELLLGINPYFKYDMKWIGLGLGAQLGNIRWVPGSPVDKEVFERGTRFSPVMPELMIRVGRKDIVDIQYNYGFNLPASVPVLLHELSIGSGFGFKTGYGIRLGAAISEEYATTFISAEALIGKDLGLALKYNFGGPEFYLSDTYYPEDNIIYRKGRLSFGANYRFGYKK